jgi:hypothetical protein
VDLLRRNAALLLSALLAPLRYRRVQRGGVEVPAMRCQESLKSRIVRFAALSAFIFYLAWNAVWIAHGRIPPSILRAVGCVPCPTTGGYRSFVALCRGEFVQSFLYNPLMLVYLLLFCLFNGSSFSSVDSPEAAGPQSLHCMAVVRFAADRLGGEVCSWKAILVIAAAGGGYGRRVVIHRIPR